MRNCSAVLFLLVAACAADSELDARDGRGGAGGKADEDESGARFRATWRLESLASNSVLACPAGFDTVALYSQPLAADGSEEGSPIIDLFDCAAGHHATALLEPGKYRVWLEITDHSATTAYAKSTSVEASVDADGTAIDFSILNDGGYFSLQWNFVGASSNQPLTCEQITGLAGVETVATSIASSTDVFVDQFDCATKLAITGGLKAGTYTVSVDAFNDANHALGTAPAVANKTIEAPNKVTHLGSVTIPITGR